MEIVELRVHGVHGTSPGAMLGVSDGEAGQVAGDKLTGIYRIKDGKPPYRKFGQAPISVEAYSWGALTSGVQGVLGWVKRALWLLLLPFALANLAYWARLEIGRANRNDVRGAQSVRVCALLLTVFMILSPCVVVIDMIGWQCYRYGVPGCTQVPGQLDFLATLTAPRRLAVTSLVPMLLVGLLWVLSRKTLIRYEETPAPKAAPLPSGTTPPDPGRRPILCDPDLWSSKARTLRLQRLHLGAAVATVCAFSGLHVVNTTGGGSAFLLVTTVASCVLLAASAVLTALSHPRDLESPPPGAPAPNEVNALREHAGWFTVVCVAVYLLHVSALWWAGGNPAESVDFLGHNIWFIAVFVLLAALTLAVFAGGRMPTESAISIVVILLGSAITAAVLYGHNQFHGWILACSTILSILFVAALDLWHYRVRDQESHAWRGASAAVMLAAASWVGLLFTSCAVIASADYLNGPDHSVADLASKIPASNEQYERDYVASGKVVVRNANVVIAESAEGDATVTVHSGSVTVDGLSLRVTDDDDEPQGYAVGRGTTTIDDSSSLTVPSSSVDFEDSCIMESGVAELEMRCTAERDSFRAGGVLDVTQQSLVIDPSKEYADEEVVLTNANPPQQPLVVPQVLIWTPIGLLVWLVLVLLALLSCVAVYWFTAGKQIAEFLPRKDGSVVPDKTIPPRDRAACRGKRRVAGLAHRAERLLDVVGLITIPVGTLITVLSFTGRAPWEIYEWLRPFATVSMYAVFAMSLALVALGSQLRRSESARKAVGVIWDLTTFWPRAAHPLAPPCYAERVVPELQIRTQWALKGKDNRVIISGHSQGSLIVAAMVSRLDKGDLSRVRMITYGSQIRALYGRVFPGVFGPEAMGYAKTDGSARLSEGFPDTPNQDPDRTVSGPPVPPAGSLRGRLEADGGGWVNLFRRTDPLGYRVFSDLDSSLDVPVAEVPLDGVGDPGPRVMTHSGYQHTLAYRTAVSSWTEEEPVHDPDGTQKLPILPPL